MSDSKPDLVLYFGGSMECSAWGAALPNKEDGRYKIAKSHWNIELTVKEMLEEINKIPGRQSQKLTKTLERVQESSHRLSKLIEKIIFHYGDGLRFECRYEGNQESWIILVRSWDYESKLDKVEIIAKHNTYKGAIKQAMDNEAKEKIKSRDEYVTKVLFRNLDYKKEKKNGDKTG